MVERATPNPEIWVRFLVALLLRFQQQFSLSPPKIRGYSLIGRAARENLEDIGSSPF